MELAISLVFLLVLLTVMVDLGWAFYTLIAMRDTVQEAAAYGSICPKNPDRIKERLLLTAEEPLDISAMDPNDISIVYLDSTGSASTGPTVDRGGSIQVRLDYDHQIVVPLVSTFIGRDVYPLHVTVTDTVLRSAPCN